MKSYNFLTSGIDFKNIDINDVIFGMKVQTSTTLIVDEIILKIEHSFSSSYETRLLCFFYFLTYRYISSDISKVLITNTWNVITKYRR